MSPDIRHRPATTLRQPLFSLRHLLVVLRPDLTALIAFTLLWMGIMLAYGAKLHLVEGSTLLPGYFALFFLALAAVGHLRSRLSRPDKVTESFPRRSRRILRDWLPVVGLLMVYETLRDYTGLIRSDYIDAELYRMDLGTIRLQSYNLAIAWASVTDASVAGTKARCKASA